MIDLVKKDKIEQFIKFSGQYPKLNKMQKIVSWFRHPCDTYRFHKIGKYEKYVFAKYGKELPASTQSKKYVEFINKTTREIQKITDSRYLLEYTGKTMHDFLAPAIITVNRYDKDKEVLKSVHSFGTHPGSIRNFMLNNLKIRSVEGVEYDLKNRPDVIEGLSLNHLKERPSLYETSLGFMKKEQAEFAQKTFDLNYFAVMGIVSDDEVYGNISIIMTKDPGYEKKMIIESFIKQISDAYKRIKYNQRAEKNLRLADDRINSVSTSFFEMDLKGNFTYLNDAIFKLFGYEKSEPRKFNVIDVIHPKDHKRLQENLKELMIKKRTDGFNEYRCVGINGKVIDALIITNPIYDEDNDGVIIGFRGHVIDNRDNIAERKRMQALVKTSKIISSARDEENSIKEILTVLRETCDADRAYYYDVVDKDGELFARQNMEVEKKGLKSNMGMPELQKIDIRYFFPEYEKLIENNGHINSVVSRLHSPLKEHEMMFGTKAMAIYPVFIQKRLVGVLGIDRLAEEKEFSEYDINIMQNISTHVGEYVHAIRHRDEILALSRYNEDLIDRANVMIIGLAEKDATITMFNKKAEEITGYLAKEVIGTSWFEKIVPEKIHPEVKNIYMQMIDGKKMSSEGTNKIYTKEGHARVIDFSNMYTYDHQTSQISGIVSFGKDRTEEQRLELTRDLALTILQHANRSENIDEFSDILLKEVSMKMGFRPVGLYFFDEQSKEIEIYRLHPEDVKGFLQSSAVKIYERELFRDLFESDEPYYHDFRLYSPDAKNRFGVNSAMIVPLKKGDKVIGSLNVASPKDRLEQYEIDTLATVGSIAANAFSKLMAERDNREQAEHDEFMAECFEDLNRMESKGQVQRYIARRFSERIEKSIVTVSDIDESESRFSFRQVEGFGSKTFKTVRSIIRQTTGKDLSDMQFPLNEVYGKSLVSNEFIELDSGVHELSGGVFPKFISDQIENILGKEMKMYSSALIFGGKLYGSVGIITRYGNDVKDFSAYDNIMRFAALVMHRIKYSGDLRAEYTKLEMITNSSRDVIGLTDIDMKNIFVNKAYKTVFEIEPEDAIGEFLIGKVRPEDRNNLEEHIHELRTGQVDNANIEISLITVNGNEKRVSIISSVIRDDEDKPINYLHVLRDVTKERSAQKKIFELEKQKELGGILNDMNHEVNNAATASRLAAEVAKVHLLKELKNQDSFEKAIRQGDVEKLSEMYQNTLHTLGKLDRNLDKVSDGIMRASKILKLSKQYAEKKNIAIDDKLTEFDLKTVIMSVKSVKDMIITDIKGTQDCDDIKFEIISEKEGVKVIANEDLFFSYLINMFKNSVYEFKNPREGGRISDEYYFRIYVSETIRKIGGVRKDVAEIIIEDNGPNGISDDIADNLFEQKVYSKKKTDGTGLFNMSRMIRLWGGECRLVSSSAGKTAFALYLPMKKEEMQRRVDTPNESLNQVGHIHNIRNEKKNLQVLVIDDDNIVGDRLGKILQTMNCSSDYVPNTSKAREMMKKNRYDIIISDYDLGEKINGLDFLMQIKSKDYNIPCILISGNDPDNFDLQKVGILEDFIPKTELTPKRLTNALSKYCDDLF